MEFSLSLNKPLIYQTRKNFINCLEYLVCSYIQAHQLPYQWLFSDSWGFYYDTMESISVTKKEEASPFWINLKKLYKVETKKCGNKSLLDVVQDTVSRNTCLFTFGEAWHIPWHTYAYQKVYAPHYFIITDYDKSSNQVFVVDWIPEYSGWVSFEQINEAYLVGGTRCFELSVPSLGNISILLMDQLRSCHNKIIGESTSESLSGLFGIEKFKDDLIDFGDESLIFLDLWWESFKPVSDSRDGFVEFIYYLDKDPTSPFNAAMDPQFIITLDQMTSKWMAFRNVLMKSKMTGVFDAKRNAERLEKIIELEQQCAFHLEKIIR